MGQSYEKKGEGAYKNQRGTLIGLISEVKCCAIAQSGFIIEWYSKRRKNSAKLCLLLVIFLKNPDI